MRATKLAVLMMLPPTRRPLLSSVGFLRIARIAYLHPHHTPLTLMFMVRSQMRSSVLSALSSSGCMIPALLNCGAPCDLSVRARGGVRRTHHDVEAAKRGDRLVDHALYAFFFAHIGFDGDRLDVGVPFADELVGLLDGLLVNVSECDVRAFLREEQRAFEADAAVNRTSPSVEHAGAVQSMPHDPAPVMRATCRSRRQPVNSRSGSRRRRTLFCRRPGMIATERRRVVKGVQRGVSRVSVTVRQVYARYRYAITVVCRDHV